MFDFEKLQEILRTVCPWGHSLEELEEGEEEPLI